MRSIAIAVVATAWVPAWAAGQSPTHLPDLSIEDLLGVSVQRVFGASERLQPVTEAPRGTLAGNTVSAATVAHVTFSARITDSFEVVGTVRNLFNQPFADPGSDEHVPDSIQQNGRTARVSLRWNLWTR